MQRYGFVLIPQNGRCKKTAPERELQKGRLREERGGDLEAVPVELAGLPGAGLDVDHFDDIGTAIHRVGEDKLGAALF